MHSANEWKRYTCNAFPYWPIPWIGRTLKTGTDCVECILIVIADLIIKIYCWWCPAPNLAVMTEHEMINWYSTKISYLCVCNNIPPNDVSASCSSSKIPNRPCCDGTPLYLLHIPNSDVLEEYFSMFYFYFHLFNSFQVGIFCTSISYKHDTYSFYYMFSLIFHFS